MHLLKYSLVAMLFTLLSGCVNQVLVKDMTINKNDFANQNFSTANISKDILTQISKDGAPSHFKLMKLKFDLSIETIRKEKENPKLDLSITDLGNGLTQEIYELSNNDIPFFLGYTNQYRGLFRVRQQLTRINRSIAPFPIEIKQFTKFTPLPSAPKQDEEYEYVYSTGTQPQLVSFLELKVKCKFGTSYPAIQFHPKLEGAATDLNCEHLKNNVVDIKSKLVFLQKYGIAFATEEIASSSTTKYKITDVKVE